jgi:hypothetical protein
MIGRGSRKLDNKSDFKIIDLGNNVRRFGLWQDYINWQDAFRFPDRFLESRISEMEDMEFEVEFEFPKGFDKVVNTEILDKFSIKETYFSCIEQGFKGKKCIELSLDNHYESIQFSSKNLDHALALQNVLQDHIEHRIKQYTKCISKSTDNYLKYLLETYNRQLSQKIRLNIEE